MSRPDLDRHVREAGPVGDYLWRTVVERGHYSLAEPGSTKVMWDLVNVAWLVDPAWLTTGLVPTPGLDDELRWTAPAAGRPPHARGHRHRPRRGDRRPLPGARRSHQGRDALHVRGHREQVEPRSASSRHPTPGNRQVAGNAAGSQATYATPRRERARAAVTVPPGAGARRVEDEQVGGRLPVPREDGLDRAVFDAGLRRSAGCAGRRRPRRGRPRRRDPALLPEPVGERPRRTGPRRSTGRAPARPAAVGAARARRRPGSAPPPGGPARSPRRTRQVRPAARSRTKGRPRTRFTGPRRHRGAGRPASSGGRRLLPARGDDHRPVVSGGRHDLDRGGCPATARRSTPSAVTAGWAIRQWSIGSTSCERCRRSPTAVGGHREATRVRQPRSARRRSAPGRRAAPRA